MKQEINKQAVWAYFSGLFLGIAIGYAVFQDAATELQKTCQTTIARMAQEQYDQFGRLRDACDKKIAEAGNAKH